MNILLVGETNPYGADPRFALYHQPRHASGNRLREHLGLSDNVYAVLRKVNLCTTKWTMKQARAHALLLEEVHLRQMIVMLGTKVKTAFELDNLPFFKAVEILNQVYVSLPHPSGLNRLWNTPDARPRAQDLLRLHAPEVPWGSTTSGT